MYEDIPTARARNHRAQFSDRERSEQGVHTAEDPDANEQFCGWQLRSDFAGSAQNPHSNRAADSYGETKADAENAQKLSAIGRRLVIV